MKPKTIFLAVWCQLSRIGGQVWWRFPHRFERTQPSKWFCEVQLPKRADRDVSVKCLLPGHSCVSAQCPSWTFRTAQDEHTWGWAGSSSVFWPISANSTRPIWPIWAFLVGGRSHWTTEVWGSDSGNMAPWQRHSHGLVAILQMSLGDGAVGAPMTYGFLHGHLWILWAPSKWTTSGLRLQHGHGPYSIGSFRTISFCHFWLCEQALMHGTSVPARIADAAPTPRRYAKIRPNPSMKHVPTCNSIAC